MIKVEHVLMFDNYGVTMIDNLGAVGKCCWCCGFPFPCCFAPCAPFPCGLCGTSCSRPEGESLPKFFEAWMLKGPVSERSELALWGIITREYEPLLN